MVAKLEDWYGFIDNAEKLCEAQITGCNKSIKCDIEEETKFDDEIAVLKDKLLKQLTRQNEFGGMGMDMLASLGLGMGMGGGKGGKGGRKEGGGGGGMFGGLRAGFLGRGPGR